MNIPSAPMFHTLARKPTASPRPMRMSGEALSSHSETPLAELRGRIRKTWRVSKGSRSRMRKKIDPKTTVSANAATGASTWAASEGVGRGSN